MCDLWQKLINDIPHKKLHLNSDGIYQGVYKETLCRDLDAYVGNFAKKLRVETPSSVDTIFYSKKQNALCFVEFKDTNKARTRNAARNIEKEEKNTLLLKAFSTLFVLMQERDSMLKELFTIDKIFFLFHTTNNTSNNALREHYRNIANKSRAFPFCKQFQLPIRYFDQIILEQEAMF